MTPSALGRFKRAIFANVPPPQRVKYRRRGTCQHADPGYN